MVRYSHRKQIRWPVTMPDGTAVHIEKRHWGEGRVKKSHLHYRLINNVLEEMEKEIEGICFSFMAKGMEPTPKKVRQAYKDRNLSTLPVSAFKAFLKTKKHNSTQQYINVRDRLSEIEELAWGDLDDFFPEKFYRESWVSSTRAHNLGLLKEFLDFATAKGWNNNLNYKTWKESVISYPQASLNIREIATLYNAKVSEFNQIGKDLFLWLIFSGMRYGETLREYYIEDDILIFHREKGRGRQYHRIKINSIMEEIMSRYEGMPIIKTNKTANKKIRAACFEAGIDSMTEVRTGLKPKYQAITTHTGRRTFTTLARTFGIATEDIQRVLDHSQTSTTAGYDQSGAEIGFKVMTQFETKIIPLIKQA